MGNPESAAHVAAELRAARARRRMTQVEVAKRANLAPNTVRRLEAGERDVSLGQILALAEALDISPHVFLVEPERQQ